MKKFFLVSLLCLPCLGQFSQLPDYKIVPNFLLEVAAGNVPGYSHVNKFGHNRTIAITGEDVWAGGGTYDFYPTTAQAMDFVSTDADDNATGTGARSVIVYGLNGSWEEISETVIPNGTTPVALDSTYIRMYRAAVLTAGSSETNEGNLTIDANVGGEVAVYIYANDGQTQQAIYTIPSGKTGFFMKGYVAMQNDNKNGEDAQFQWLFRPNNGVTGAWQVKGQISLINIGSSHWQYEYGVPAGPIPEKTDIRIAVIDASAIVGAVAGFDIIMIDD